MSDADYVLSETEFPCKDHRLHCKMATPAGRAWARLCIIHGYGEHVGRYGQWMRWLATRGVASAAMDLRGHGRSTGRRGFVHTWEDYLEDLETFLAAQSNSDRADAPLPLFIMGHSHGGLIATAAGERGILARAKVTGCILASPYLGTRLKTPLRKRMLAYAADRVVPWLRVRTGVRSHFLTSDPNMVAEDQADTLLNHSATPRWYFTMRKTQARVMSEASRFTLPMLCIIGESDQIADPQTAAAFFRACSSPDKSLYTYPTRLHELFRETGRERIFADVMGWIRSRV